jgi:hypothetical protein
MTLQAIGPRIADNVTLGNPTFAYLREAGRVQMEDGGDYLQEVIQWTLNGNAQSYTGWDALSITAQDEFTAATYNWKQYSVSPSMNGLERIRNSGPLARINLWASKAQVAENSMISLLDQHLHADQTTKGVKDILGLDEFVEETPAGTVGGINRAVETWWKNKTTNGTVATITQACRSAINKAREGRESPKMGVCPLEPFEAIINQNAGKQRLVNQTMMDLGYENIMIDGVTLMWNRNCIGNGVTTPSVATPWNIYFLNTNFLKLRIYRDRNFSPVAPEKPLTQDAEVAFLLFAGALTLSNSRFQSVLVVNG